MQARRLGVRVGKDCRFGAHVDLSLGSYENYLGEISIGDQGWIEQGVILWAFGGRIRIGKSVYLGQYSVIYGHGGVEIGEQTLVSMHCCILSSNHTIASRDRIIRQQPDIRLPTKIGRDVWLGAGVKVLGGVTIGDGCVVGAGAVVVDDLSAYSIAVGVPAKVVGQRN
jgi:acetyltransferase-like isoleucine patch superfamily enzyme